MTRAPGTRADEDRGRVNGPPAATRSAASMARTGAQPGPVDAAAIRPSIEAGIQSRPQGKQGLDPCPPARRGEREGGTPLAHLNNDVGAARRPNVLGPSIRPKEYTDVPR